MILDDVGDKAIEALQAAKGKLEESDLYVQLKERYDSLAPPVQKLVLVFAGLIVAYLVALFPLSFYDKGSENIALFEENRDLILDLYRVKRKAASTPESAQPMDSSDLQSRARTAVTNARVQADQIKTISAYDNAGPHASGFIPKSVSQQGVDVQLANVTVNQIVEIGHALATLGDSAKMVGLEIKAGNHPGNYFDASFKVVSFGIAGPPAAKEAPTKKK